MADILQIVPDGDVSESDKSVVKILGTESQFRILNRRAHAYSTFSFGYEFVNATERLEMYTFFTQKKGKYIPFWLRSFHPEFVMTEEGIAGQSHIYVELTETTITLDEKPTFIYLRDIDWAMRVNDVVAGRTDPDTGAVISSKLLLAGALPEAVEITEGRACQVERLYYVRFDQDTISFEHKELMLTTCKIKFRELPHESPSFIVHP